MATRALSPSGTTRITLRVPTSMTEAADLEADRRGIDRSALLRQLLANGLDWSEEAEAS